jgi:hypothetical protein
MRDEGEFTSNRVAGAAPIPTHFVSLCEVAQMSSWLAKRLAGSERVQAYRIKSRAISSLILAGFARVNGVRANGTVALEFPTDPPTRLHTPLTHLCLAARARIVEGAATAPVVAPLSELAKISRS